MKKRKLSKRVKLIRAFKKFLYDNNCLTEYYKYIKNPAYTTGICRDCSERCGRTCRFYGSFTKLSVNYPPQNWIIRAFNWASTPEKGDYWYNINRLWIDYYQLQRVNL